MSTPQNAEEWVVRLHGGRVTLADRWDFQRWMRNSSQNRAAYENALAVWRTASRLSQSPRAGRLMAEARFFLDNAQPRTRRWWIPQVAVGSLAAVVVLLLIIRNEPVERTYKTAVAQIKHVHLADGTELDVSPETELSVTFRRSTREIRLAHGEAFLSVGHDDARPLVVLVGATEIRDIGTRFDIATDRGEVEVAVAEGQIRVSAQGAATDQGPVVMAGSVLRIDAAGHYSELPHTGPQQVAAWRTGWLSYGRTPLGRIVRDINRYNVTQLVIADPQLAELQLAGAFRANDLAALVASLQDIYGIQARSAGNTIELYRRRPR